MITVDFGIEPSKTDWIERSSHAADMMRFCFVWSKVGEERDFDLQMIRSLILCIVFYIQMPPNNNSWYPACAVTINDLLIIKTALDFIERFSDLLSGSRIGKVNRNIVQGSKVTKELNKGSDILILCFAEFLHQKGLDCNISNCHNKNQLQ